MYANDNDKPEMRLYGLIIFNLELKIIKSLYQSGDRSFQYYVVGFDSLIDINIHTTSIYANYY